MCVVRITVTKNNLYWYHGYLLVQNADRIQNVDCRLQIGYKMQTENLKSFFVWSVITCHPATYRLLRFSAISFHDYLQYCRIFLAHFLMKIDRKIISSLHIVFSLCAQVGWCDVCTDFTNVIKVDIDGNEMSTIKYLIRATFEKQVTALHVARVINFLSGMFLFC